MRITTLIACLSVVAVWLTTAGAEDIDNESCLACHGVEGAADSAGKPVYVSGDEFGASVHNDLSCTTCHADITEVPHPEKPKPIGTAPCAACHAEVDGIYEQSVHGKAQANGTTEAATCISCHGSPHAVQRATNPGSPVYPLNLPRTCGTCHGDPELAKRHNIPVADAYQLYMDSIHGRALTRSGLLVAANCSSCHGFHDVKPKSDPQSKVFRSSIPSTCGGCHAGVTNAYFDGVHGKASRAGKQAAPVCVDCHTAHQIKRVETKSWKLGAVGECGSCHMESLKTYRDTFHGQVTTLGFTLVARCSDCHESHRVLPASDPQSSIASVNLVATCRKCHPQANENFTQFLPHADPNDRERNPGLYFTARFMDFLIVGVFAFFGVHTALWLLRSLIHVNSRGRGTAGPPPSAG